MPIFYRVDSRPFNEGDEVLSQGDHLEQLECDHKEIELRVRKKLADGEAIRGRMLHVFRDETAARDYWPWKKDRYLYSLRVEDDDIRHVGDMRLFNEAATLLNEDPGAVDEVVGRYCDGHFGPDPCVEVMVVRGRVCEVLGQPHERQAEFNSRHKLSSHADYDDDEYDRLIGLKD